MSLVNISQFFPSGTQMKTPKGMYFNPFEIVSIIPDHSDMSIIFVFKAYVQKVEFYRNIDSSPPKVYDISRNICEYTKGTVA